MLTEICSVKIEIAIKYEYLIAFYANFMRNVFLINATFPTLCKKKVGEKQSEIPLRF